MKRRLKEEYFNYPKNIHFDYVQIVIIEINDATNVLCFDIKTIKNLEFKF